VISVPPGGRGSCSGENRAPPSGFAAETNNKCQIKSKLLHFTRRTSPLPQAAGVAAFTVHLRQPRLAKSLYFHTPDRALRSL
jgi:hypothetical protein